MACGEESYEEENTKNQMTSRGENYEEVIGMRKIGYPVGEKAMRKSMKQRKMVDSDRGKSRQGKINSDKQ